MTEKQDPSLRDLLGTWRGFDAPIPPPHPTLPPWRMRLVFFSTDAPLYLYGIEARYGNPLQENRFWYVDAGAPFPLDIRPADVGQAVQMVLKQHQPPFAIRSVVVQMETRGRMGMCACQALLVWAKAEKARDVVRCTTGPCQIYDLEGRMPTAETSDVG